MVGSRLVSLNLRLLRIGLQVKLVLLNLYVVGSRLVSLNLIGSDFKLSSGGERERERNEQLTGGKEQKIILTFLYFSLLVLLILVAMLY